LKIEIVVSGFDEAAIQKGQGRNRWREKPEEIHPTTFNTKGGARAVEEWEGQAGNSVLGKRGDQMWGSGVGKRGAQAEDDGWDGQGRASGG
jgi:hypothetical protein